MGHKWRVIPLTTNNAAMNMAIDESISDAVAAEQAMPTIRFYRWNPSAVSIGYFQSLHDEVNLPFAQREGIPVVRRRTGGGAVYHDYHGEITYSVIAPEDFFPKDIIQSYREICGWVISSLKQLNISAEFHPINDILVAGKKISGNAQTRRSKVLLQHGTILLDLNIERMFSVLKISKEKISDKMIKNVRERVTRLLNHGTFSHDDLYQALLKGFTEGKEWETGQLSSEEKNRAEQLVKEKYSQMGWNARR